MRSKLSDLKSLYTTLGGESTDVLSANSEIAVLNGILALGNVDSSKFIPDAIKAIADNFALIDPSPVATLIEKTVTANGTYNATSDSANGYSQVNVAVPVPSTFSVNITATTTTDTTFGITTDKTFSETMQALNNGDNNVVATLTIIADGVESVYENVCCGIAHADNEFIYITVESEEVHSGPVIIHWLSNSDTATAITFSSTYISIGR